jgi:hypothetical protein
MNNAPNKECGIEQSLGPGMLVHGPNSPWTTAENHKKFLWDNQQ